MIQFNWPELISFGLNIVLFTWGIYQLASGKKEEENTKSKVRIWQNQAEGIKNALLAIAWNPNQSSSKEDMASSVQAVAQSAVAFDKSFVEERFYTDKEIKDKREKSEEEFKSLLQRASTGVQVSQTQQMQLKKNK